MPFSLSTRQQVVQLLLDQVGQPYRYVVTPNAYHVVTVHDNPSRLLPIYRGAWLSLCDSQVLRALAKLDNRSLPLVTGSDLTGMLLSTLNGRDDGMASARILVVGPDRSAAAALGQVYQNLTIDVMPAPAGLAQNAELRLTVARNCVAQSWDILLLCVGCPAQEQIAWQIGQLGRKTGIALCVGAAIDFLTGKRVRSPLWVQISRRVA
jgi:UDP-N-acetyl-D-mannosaminuronic acid transferase (WecB/TagA/CpsF family)